MKETDVKEEDKDRVAFIVIFLKLHNNNDSETFTKEEMRIAACVAGNAFLKAYVQGDYKAADYFGEAAEDLIVAYKQRALLDDKEIETTQDGHA